LEKGTFHLGNRGKIMKGFSDLKSLLPSKRTVVLVLAVIVITVILSAAFSILLSRFSNLRLPSLGTIMTEGVEAYWDENLTNKISTDEKIDWGTLKLGTSKNVTFYLLSISNIETILNLTEKDLLFYDGNGVAMQPPSYILTYMNLSWNYNGSVVRPGDVIHVTVTLSAGHSPDFVTYLIDNDVRRFTLDIHIRTLEYVASSV
jgi:hypothetical protein